MKTLLYLFIGILSLGIAFADITGSETMTRSVPTTATKGSPVTITYTAVGTSGSWGASIEESVSGGCTFPSGAATYRTVMLSEDGVTKSVTLTTPNADTTCTLTGDYKYGTLNVVAFPEYPITVGTPSGCQPDWACGAWSNAAESCGTRTCTDANSCGVTTGKPIESVTCPTPTPTPSDPCQFFETKKDGECVASQSFFWVIGIVIVALMFLKRN